MPRSALQWLSFVLLGCALYATILGTFFLSDDFLLLKMVADFGPFAVWSGPSSRDVFGHFLRPLISLSFFVDHALWGLRPLGFHLTNLLFHGSSAYLTFRIAGLLLPGRTLAGWFAGLAFLALPVHVEPVTWISGRTDLISSCFGLFAFFFYLRALESSRRRYPRLALLAFVGALLAKEPLVCLPLVIAAHQWLVGGRLRGRGGRLALALAGCVPLYLVARRLAVGSWIGGYGALHSQHDPRFLGANLLRYVVHVCGFGVQPTGTPTLVAVAVVALALLAAPLLYVRERGFGEAPPARLLWFLAVAFAVSLLPTLNIPISQPGTEFDRYLYLPSVWLTILWAATITPALAKPARLMLAASLLAACSLLLVARNARWREAGELSRQAVDALGALPNDRPVFALNLPDSVQDAYVLRNGYTQALELFAPHPPRLLVVAHQRLQQPGDLVVVAWQGDRVHLELPAGGSLEYWFPPPSPPIRFERQTEAGFDIRIDPAGPGLPLTFVVFEHGRLRRID